jgi:hypothetical protein
MTESIRVTRSPYKFEKQYLPSGKLADLPVNPAGLPYISPDPVSLALFPVQERKIPKNKAITFLLTITLSFYDGRN